MSFISSLKSFITMPGRLAQHETQSMSHPPGALPGKLAGATGANGASVIGDLKAMLAPMPGAASSQVDLQVDLQAEAARSIRQATRLYV
ncbi:hypothetical protein J5T34_05480 [Cupriavidus gilardii]|uniref:hypothetical protein n=1 Tax=Cupriavidus gilardii TaxID=82541 RepID=UPI001ABE6CCC|nr:hypothetical protein [Cupriavidus gilardii]MBO4120190.1 hypothetical protein [Cupriavidus gilardii]